MTSGKTKTIYLSLNFSVKVPADTDVDKVSVEIDPKTREFIVQEMATGKELGRTNEYTSEPWGEDDDDEE